MKQCGQSLEKKHCYYSMWKHAYYIALDAYSFRRNWASSKHSLQDWQREQQAEGGKQDCIDIVVQWMKLDALCFDQLSQRQEILKVNYASLWPTFIHEEENLDTELVGMSFLEKSGLS